MQKADSGSKDNKQLKTIGAEKSGQDNQNLVPAAVKNTEYSNEGDNDQIVNVKTSLPKRPMTTANPNVNK